MEEHLPEWPIEHMVERREKMLGVNMYAQSDAIEYINTRSLTIFWFRIQLIGCRCRSVMIQALDEHTDTS